MKDNLLLEHLVDWGNDKGEETKMQEKAQFRNDNAEPLWKDFKLWPQAQSWIFQKTVLFSRH